MRISNRITLLILALSLLLPESYPLTVANAGKPSGADVFTEPTLNGWQTGSSTTPQAAIEKIEGIVKEVVRTSYPELTNATIKVRAFSNTSDYFRTRFGIPQFVSGKKMEYLMMVNPQVFDRNCPESAIRAIVAHELGHVLYFSQRKRIRLLSLIRLESKSYTARFERWTDLQAIARGYGEGLKQYRQWLYKNVPERSLNEKRRDYFSPEEIDAILLRLRARPQLLNYWLKQVPRNLKEIEHY